MTDNHNLFSMLDQIEELGELGLGFMDRERHKANFRLFFWSVVLLGLIGPAPARDYRGRLIRSNCDCEEGENDALVNIHVEDTEHKSRRPENARHAAKATVVPEFLSCKIGCEQKSATQPYAEQQSTEAELTQPTSRATHGPIVTYPALSASTRT
jgi:hypothetical protein